MNLELTPEQETFREEVRSFIQARLPDEIRQRLRHGHLPRKQDTVIWQRILAERGWAAPHWPRAYGGAELGQMERLILLDELQRAPAPVPQVFNINMLGPVLLEFGTPAQREYFLPRLANLDLWFCQGFSEPGAGSDLASLRTAARREGDHYVVNGQKIWTSSAQWSDWMFALVRTDPETRKQGGISFLLIDLKIPGITIRPIQSIDGSHHLNEVFLEDVHVPVENLVGEENKGWDCAKFLLANERSGIANVGLCRERLEYARELAASTIRGGRRLADNANLCHEMALLDAEIRALELTNLRFLLSPREQAAVPAFASVLKLKGTELQQDVNALLARLTSLSGLEHHDAESESVSESHLVERYLFSRATSIYGGSSEIQKDILGKSILG
ncbi:MAG: acyl-CoA dehydrogenase family protein [Rhodocyclaceae bacterium]|nr:acyl-CoA dehydrogenase family protein [Rhodocyclaceae bacterium]